MDQSLLLSREKYAEEMAKRGKAPFTFEIETNKQILFYFGANHSRDPENLQYPILRDYWQKFLNKTQDKERIVLIETNLRKVGADEEESIRNGSEGNLITILAVNSNIEVACPEPEYVDLIRNSLEQFPKKYVAYYYFYVLVSNWQRLPEPKEGNFAFKSNFKRFLDIVTAYPVWGDFDYSLNNMKIIHKELFNREFHENEKNDFLNPNKDETVINKIARVTSDTRDLHITSEIERYWKEGKSILVVFGSGHLIIQEPALRALLK